MSTSNVSSHVQPRKGKLVVTRGRKASAQQLTHVGRTVTARILNNETRNILEALFMGTETLSASLWAVLKVSAVCMTAAISLTGIWWYGKSFDPEIPGKYLEANRNYAMVPFDMLDAQNICEAKTRVRYGETLVRTLMDYHSTRYEERSGLYKIFLSAHVGDKKIYDESVIHCFVNPNEYMIEHFRVFKKEQKSIMQRAKTLIHF